ncbi:MAG: hypothetical protein ABI947_18245 [Chloroflexota bacterium]
MTSSIPKTQESGPSPYFERHVARLLVILYYCGQPINTLLEGETRQIDSLTRLQLFDFWVREPGHLALALLRSFGSAPERVEETNPNVREAIQRMLKDNQADVRRVKLPNATHSHLEDLDFSLSYLTARHLLSDRPSFARSRQFTHQVVLETPGVEFVQKILKSAPTFEWYRLQSELVAANFNRLEHYDLAMMSYLAPDLNPAIAATLPLIPYIRTRYEQTFGDPAHDAVV